MVSSRVQIHGLQILPLLNLEAICQQQMPNDSLPNAEFNTRLQYEARLPATRINSRIELIDIVTRW
jgi:hypothetical protein